jgi:hypothetical protein
MLDPSLRLALVAALCMSAAACGGDAKTSDATAKASATAAEPVKSAEGGKVDTGKPAADTDASKAEAGAKSTDAGEAEVGKAEGAGAEEGKAEGGQAEGAGAEEGKASGGKADDGKADAGAEGGAAPVDPAPLLDEAKAKKTTDERAMAALTEAETAGAKPRDLAKVANARGEKLFDTPERAKAFFEWAAQKDPKYPEPAFNLAKQAAMQGEVDLAKEWLVKTHERGGKKLLKQLGFDPMWEIVKDDPDIRKLYE